MKKRILFVLLSALLACFFTMSAFAITARASEQISSYTTSATPLSDGDIKISFKVYGTAMMDELGAEEITVYRHSGSNWVEVDYYDRNDSGMTSTNTSRHSGSVTFNGTSGVEYKVEITIFAEDENGYDSRTKTYTVTAK